MYVCMSTLHCSALNAGLQYKSKGERALKIYVGVSASLHFLECYLYAYRVLGVARRSSNAQLRVLHVDS